MICMCTTLKMKNNLVKTFIYVFIRSISHINSLALPHGHNRHFLQNLQLTAVSTKWNSASPQLSPHSNFPTSYNWNQIFNNPQLNQTDPKTISS
jgi:hypothetical protein